MDDVLDSVCSVPDHRNIHRHIPVMVSFEINDMSFYLITCEGRYWLLVGVHHHAQVNGVV